VRQADNESIQQASSRASKIQERISQLVNFTGPESKEQSEARTKKILDLKGKLTGTPLGLNPKFYDFLSKDSGLSDDQITKIISQPPAPLLQFDKRGFNKFGNYDPDQDQIRMSLPEGARDEYDTAVAQSVFSGPVGSLFRATASQVVLKDSGILSYPAGQRRVDYGGRFEVERRSSRRGLTGSRRSSAPRARPCTPVWKGPRMWPSAARTRHGSRISIQSDSSLA
jgi:hypothetical protein